MPSAVEEQSEDCLYLNVWTAAEPASERQPVIVWLHPGGFQFGSGSEPLSSGQTWAQAGVVFVSVNFRLSHLGFLAHPALQAEDEDGRTGNYGLLDQIAALHWVRDHIAEFGGDPHCVTIFGISSGASSVSLLMNTPQAQGLFHRVIAESGGSFGPVAAHTGIGDRWQSLAGACASGESWATQLGAHTAQDLRAIPVERIRDAGVGQRNAIRDIFDGARPIIDGQIIPIDTRARFAAGEQAAVPLLVGSAANEDTATLTYSPDLASFLDHGRREHHEHLREFLTLYPAQSDEQAAALSLRANGHRLFTWQNWIWARLHATAGNPVYYYRFEQAPPVPPGRYAQQRIARPLGAFHTASILYAFGHFGIRPEWPWSDADRWVAATLTATWVEFARTGRPSRDELPPWPTFDPADPMVMRLSAAPSHGPVPELQYLNFWDHFYDRQDL